MLQREDAKKPNHSDVGYVLIVPDGLRDRFMRRYFFAKGRIAMKQYVKMAKEYTNCGNGAGNVSKNQSVPFSEFTTILLIPYC
ncbi:MAG: hypothetical protein D3906_02920 [Candidatus Electrothrix sp. AUS1_2]|nr:hypothetical protein [Candidatus Electrothrix sp. AUS1_2]